MSKTKAQLQEELDGVKSLYNASVKQVEKLQAKLESGDVDTSDQHQPSGKHPVCAGGFGHRRGW